MQQPNCRRATMPPCWPSQVPPPPLIQSTVAHPKANAHPHHTGVRGGAAWGSSTRRRANRLVSGGCQETPRSGKSACVGVVLRPPSTDIPGVQLHGCSAAVGGDWTKGHVLSRWGAERAGPRRHAGSPLAIRRGAAQQTRGDGGHRGSIGRSEHGPRRLAIGGEPAMRGARPLQALRSPLGYPPGSRPQGRVVPRFPCSVAGCLRQSTRTKSTRASVATSPIRPGSA